MVATQTIEIPSYIAGTWDVDPVHSHIGFVARHMMLSKVRGRFDKFEGRMVTAGGPAQVVRHRGRRHELREHRK